MQRLKAQFKSEDTRVFLVGEVEWIDKMSISGQEEHEIFVLAALWVET